MNKSDGESSFTERKLWGEYNDEPSPEQESGSVNVSLDRLNSLIEQAMQPDILSKLESQKSPNRIQLQIGDDRILNTIELQQYYSKICDLQQKFASQSLSETEELPPEPDPPKPVDPKYIPNCFNFLPSSDSDFVNGIGVEVPDIDNKTCRAVLRRCVLLLLAQIGCTEILANTLDTFVDAVDEYYKIMTTAIQAKMDSARKGRPTEFSDIYDHVFHDLGIGGVTALHDYYQHRVLEYERCVYRKCARATRQHRAALAEYAKKKKHQQLQQLLKNKKPAFDAAAAAAGAAGGSPGGVGGGVVVGGALADETSAVERAVLHLPDTADGGGAYYIDSGLYGLLPDVETLLDPNSSSLLNMDISTQNSMSTEEVPPAEGSSSSSYFDVEDLGNFCQ